VARRDLLGVDGAEPARDWHLARLWLGPTGGGALVAGELERVALEAGYREFLDARRHASAVAVAAS